MTAVANLAIVGLGSDLLRIERIARLGVRYTTMLLDRILAPTERRAMAGLGDQPSDWPGCARHVAAVVASKEAMFKALGTGLVKPLRWVDIAIGGSAASPTLALDGASATLFTAAGGEISRLAVCGDDDFVLATVVLLGRRLTTNSMPRESEQL